MRGVKNQNPEGLEKIRRSQKISRTKLAEMSGVSFYSIKSYELGSRDIHLANIQTLKALASALNVTIDEILYGQKNDKGNRVKSQGECKAFNDSNGQNPCALKKLRRSQKLSRAKLSEMSGVSVYSIVNYERKERDIHLANIQTLKALASALNVTIDELLD